MKVDEKMDTPIKMKIRHRKVYSAKYQKIKVC